MWQRIAYTLPLMALFANSVGAAEPSTRLVNCTKWARFDVLLGRITALDPRCSQGRSINSENPEIGARETLNITVVDRVPSVHFEMANQQQVVVIDISNGDQVMLHREACGEADLATVHFTQLPDEKCVLIVSNGGEKREYSAETIWHLAVAHRNACREHLFPVLELLRPNWRLAEQVDKVEKTLVGTTATTTLTDDRKLQQLVEQLGSDTFRQRQAADRQLRAARFSALAFLDGLELSELDAEQRSRIRGIRAALRIEAGDTPQRVALWLSEDKAIWLAMLASDESSSRLAATAQLTRIFGNEIQFDPFAAEAQRSAELRRLEALLAKQSR